MSLGMMGTKLGMTQVNDEAGNRIAVTVIRTGPCLVVQKKTAEKDGYSALKLGFGEKKEKNTAKAQRKVFETLKSKPKRHLREFRVPTEELGKFEAGQEIKIEHVFKAGQFGDVAGKSKGHGFTGVMKRHNMKGNDAVTEPTNFSGIRVPSAPGTWPGYVHKNKRMGGHDGDERVTIPNLKVIQILTEENCLLVQGAVPGALNGFVIVKPAAKRPAN